MAKGYSSQSMDMTNGPLLGKIIRYSIPVMLTSILQLLYNAADIVVVGRFAGTTALAAVGAAGPLNTLTEAQFADMRWLDRRVVAILRRDESAPCGWMMEACALDAQEEMEEQASNYFSQAMVEYVNVEQGFSLQYPAVFLDGQVTEEANGISGALEDGSASFFAKKLANTEGWTLEKVMAARQQENPGAEANINDISGCGRIVTRGENGFTVADIYIVTGEWVYHAQLRYTAQLAADFSLYSDYMMNSFNADELGMG